jgi:hypothetical protein
MCGAVGMGLYGTPGRRAGASVLNPLAAGRQRFGAKAVLISCGPSCDPRTLSCLPFPSLASWGPSEFFHSKTNPTKRTLAPILGSRALADVSSATLRSKRGLHRDAVSGIAGCASRRLLHSAYNENQRPSIVLTLRHCRR